MTREMLPNRRRCETLSFWHSGVHYSVSAGYYPDGRVGEVFVEGGKMTSAADISARESAIAASIAIQHGADFDTLRDACLRRPDGSPEGALGAAMDAIAKVANR